MRLHEIHGVYVTDLRVALDGDTLVLRGEVASEACRGDAKRLSLAFDGVFKVRNELVVAAFLEAASDAEDMDNFFGAREAFDDHQPAVSSLLSCTEK